MNNTFAVDTNILIYLHDVSDKRKREIAENILSENPKISTQVISEYLNTTKRLLKLSKDTLITECAALLKDCEILPVVHTTLFEATKIIRKYDLQLFDSIIVASALEANCSILYSEDMQHDFKIDNLTIINPFI